jgi:Xaa-Pro aminopeptidase
MARKTLKMSPRPDLKRLRRHKLISWERSINIKTPYELEIMREAGRINAEALNAAVALIKPGVTTAELNAAFEAVQKKYERLFAL